MCEAGDFNWEFTDLSSKASLRYLCGPLRLCGKGGVKHFNRRGAEDRRGNAEQIFNKFLS